MATLLSVNVGMPKNVTWQDRTVYTGIWKSAVEGPRMVRRLNIDGDGQGDRNGHGGEQRAVMVYQIASYRHWQQHFDRDDFEFGQFGENFTVDGLGDDQVCLGDRYRIGEAEFEVTQPRVTCFRVGMRLGEPEMPALLVAHHRPGFYLRVITEGHVRAGDEIVRTRVGPHEMSIAEVDALLYLPHRNIERLRDAVDIPALSPGWQQSFHELLDAAEHGTTVDAPSVGLEPGWRGFRPLRVAELVAESATVTSVYLSAESGDRLPAPKAGQYLTLRAIDAGDPAPVRSYSLSSRPGAQCYRISVKREPHGVFSGYIHSGLHVGSTVDVAAPRGEFVLGDGSGAVLLISAGIGVTPELAMLYQLAAAKSERDVWWLHVARNASQHAFAAEAHELLKSLPNAHELVFYTAPDAQPGDVMPIINGRPTRQALAELHVPTDASAYICGPASFMTAMQAIVTELGITPDRIYTELFGARSPINPGIVDAEHAEPHQPRGANRTGPQITFARAGLTVRWSEQDHSLLELAEACDVPTRFSCRTGVCHTCITPLLSGEIGYAPIPLEQPGSGEALICCARPSSDVVLDL
jgi:ferredoxin-NADP reductase/MOSC domain-containing protein YiiM